MKKKSRLFVAEGLPKYKPFVYPEAFDMYKVHEVALHWTVEEIDLSVDVADWLKVNEADRHIMTAIFSGFTESDVLVGAGYDLLTRIYKPNEIKMLLRSLGNRESLHQDAYSSLLDTLGFADDIYGQFNFIPSLKVKFDYVNKARVRQFQEYVEMCDGDVIAADKEFRRSVVRMEAIYSGGTEGISLFSQFAILFNYSRTNKFPGMAKIVEWSIRDENLHIEAVSWLAKTTIKENKDIWDDNLKKDIYEAFKEIVAREDEYIDYVFSYGNPEGLTSEEMKEYIRYMADFRLKQFGLKPVYGVKVNPLGWMEAMLSSITFTNFFDSKVTEYSKGTLTGDWAEAKKKMKELFS